MALRSSIVPHAAVYLVNPVLIAIIPASAATGYVGQSGSPTVREITSWPLACNSLALATKAKVGEDFKVRALCDNMFRPIFRFYFFKFIFLIK